MPPVPQSIQSEAEFIDQDQILSQRRSQRGNSAKELNNKHLQSYFDVTQSLKGQQKLPQSLNIYVKSFNIEDMYVSFFIEPLKGQEAIKSVLIVVEIFYQISPPHPSIYTTAEDE